jgi:Spy/CpxP family protein refolding chaperone
MSIKPWLKVISILSFTYYSTNSLAQVPPNPNPYLSCVCYPKMDLVIKNFQFTDEQKQKVNVMYQDYLQQKNILRAKLLSIGQEIDQLTLQVPLDEVKFNDLILQKASIISEKIKMHTLFKVKLYQMLTPEQQKEWNKIFTTQDISELINPKH